MPRNKVQFGFSNAYFAPLTVKDVEGAETITYEKPMKLGPGRSHKADPKAESDDYYADDEILDTYSTMDGYDIEVSITEISEDFKTKILGDQLDANGMLLENPKGTSKPFAFLCQYDGDSKARRHVFYYCTAERPNMEASTSEGKIDPKEQTVKIVAKKAPGIGRIKASTSEEKVKPETYNKFFDAVVMPGEITAG